jgi:hypothetical protein
VTGLVGALMSEGRPEYPEFAGVPDARHPGRLSLEWRTAWERRSCFLWLKVHCPTYPASHHCRTGRKGGEVSRYGFFGGQKSERSVQQ